MRSVWELSVPGALLNEANRYRNVQVASYRLTTDDNALRKGWHMPPKMAAERI